MASGFIGISVVVTLQNPPNTLVHGVVAAVNPQNATLTLQDGMSHMERHADAFLLTERSVLPCERPPPQLVQY
jgi:hypothetical protein